LLIKERVVLTLTGSYIHTCHTTFYQKKTKHIQII